MTIKQPKKQHHNRSQNHKNTFLGTISSEPFVFVVSVLSYLGEMLHQAPNFWTILRHHVRAGLLLSPWTKQKKGIINPPPNEITITPSFFSNTHRPHFTYSNQFIWVNDSTHWSTPPKNHSPTPFPTELPVQQWAGEAHGFWLQTDEEWPHHVVKTCYPTAIPGLESYPCSNWTRSKHICNPTLWDLFLDCTILLQDISWFFGLWYIIW